MKIRAAITAIALTLLALNVPQVQAATSSLTLSLRQTPSATESVVTFYGTIKPARSGLSVKIQGNTSGSWKTTRFTTKTTKAGTWKIVAVATSFDIPIKYRAQVNIAGKITNSPIRTITMKKLPQISTLDPSLAVESFGPGGRIHGADVSRWQHPNDKPIDFSVAYASGLRFVMIKASDTRDEADALALKYLIMDHAAAQAAGLYTGFYHYAILPDVSDSAGIIRDATAQAQKVLWRLAAIGGYTERDLSYALDLENKCVRVSSSGACQKYASRAAVTLWAETFLGLLKEKTGRTPILYSYSNFLESSMNKSAKLAQYPLWLAQYAIDPFNPINQPGIKAGGCFVHSWTGANCDSQWTIWQYTSCGIAPKYGVPGTRLDLNIFRGSASDFLNLTKGSWVPSLVDLMPNNEPTQMLINAQSASTTNKLVTFKTTVTRPDSNPVVTGAVKLVFDAATAPKTRPVQTVLRATSGEWTLAIKGVPAGTYSGNVVYTDVSQTHAESSQAVTFTVVQGPTPSATPEPTKKPTKKPSVDGCSKQIKN
ncbi:Glycoside hydrolase, family 25 [Candidatus Planktophila vernalis]|uniref:GH25 family lysozyme n=1 Tax=Candidatus Planktophila vernalis TaxID=1884907 RepID=UPI003CE71099